MNAISNALPNAVQTFPRLSFQVHDLTYLCRLADEALARTIDLSFSAEGGPPPSVQQAMQLERRLRAVIESRIWPDLHAAAVVIADLICASLPVTSAKVIVGLAGSSAGPVQCWRGRPQRPNRHDPRRLSAA